MRKTKVVCVFCMRHVPLRKDGSMQCHHPPFNGVGTSDCRGSYTTAYKLISGEIPVVVENKKKIEINRNPVKLTASDFKKIQQKEFEDFRSGKNF